MEKKTRKRFSLILAIVLLSVTCLGNTAFAGVFAAGSRKIDVWDFGGVEESNTELYNNNITMEGMKATGSVGNGGLFVGGTTTFGDLTLTHNAKDRWYSAAEGSYGIGNALAIAKYDDGYTANGMYYANGTGGETRRHITVANVKAGDKFLVYMGSSNSAQGVLHFTYMDEGASQDVTASFTNKGARYEFVAQHDGTYKIWTEGAAGKPCYNRVVRIPGVEVSGVIDLGDTQASGYKVIFSSDVTGYETEAVLDGNKFSVVLAADEQYTAALTGATGFGFTNDTKQVKTEISDVLTGKNDVTLKVETKSTYTYSGKLTGFAADYDISKLSVTLVPPKDSLADDVTVPIASDGSFSVVLEPDVEYTAVLGGVNDYEIVEGKTIVDNKNHTSDIKVALKPVYAVSGGFLDLAKGVTVSDIKFTNVEDGYVYSGTVEADGYKAQLRDGSYAVSVTVEGYRTNTHVVVAGGEVKKDILFVSTSQEPPKELVKDIYVGYEDKGDLNYDTVNEAVAACKAMNPQSEADRITVHIASGTYREQIIIDTPYISFVNDSEDEVLLTWYYGIGYKYYSADETGYYNPENAYDKYDKKTVSKWGCSTYLKSSATGFKADGITFEASFNRYITDEELEDGVELSGGEAITVERKYGVDVTSKAATERASAMAVEADNVEFTDCAFLGSQDTLYTGAVDIYFKNCLIEGNTDYIFGDGDVVFDGCELSWYG